MTALDTVLASAVNPGAGGAAASLVASGDSAQVRSFQGAATAYIDGVTRMGTGAGFAQVSSPALHDAVTGIRINPGESPSGFAIPAEAAQSLTAGDLLSLSISGGAAETDLMALHLWYSDLGAIAGRYHLAGDIEGNIDSIKTQRVAVTSPATIGQWAETPLGATENLLVAGSDYAVLGYETTAALALVGVRGSDTGNLRAAGPGVTLGFESSQYFLYMARTTGRPYIPVINQQNVGNTFVSVAAATASVAATVTLILAQLKNRVTP